MISQYSDQDTCWITAIDSRQQQGATVQTGSGTHPVYQNGYRELLLRGKVMGPWGWALTSNLVPRLSMRGAWRSGAQLKRVKDLTLASIPHQAVPRLRRLAADLSPRSLGFNARSFHVGFAVDKVAPGQFLLQVLPFPLISIIPPFQSSIHRSFLILATDSVVTQHN
jgi:hypothetical protein